LEIINKIEKEGLIFDGGMGSMLIARGLKGGEVCEKWNIHHPEIVQAIHQAYFDAGADVVTTNTFGATSFKLARMGVKDSVEAINSAATNNAKAVARPGQYIAGELGPLGEMFAPMGTMTFDKAREIYTHQAEIIETEGVDVFLIQTVFDIQEALAALEAVQVVSAKPVICSLTFNQMKKGFYTLVGNSVVESMKKLRDCGASVVGANCSMGSDIMIQLAQEIRQSVEIPVIVQPNAGMAQAMNDGTVVYPEAETFFAENIKKMRDLGIEVVGGCCGTTPEFIRAIKDLF
jgi:5-methyltetrahydrofolate--homocysteine methyltransferase